MVLGSRSNSHRSLSLESMVFGVLVVDLFQLRNLEKMIFKFFELSKVKASMANTFLDHFTENRRVTIRRRPYVMLFYVPIKLSIC